MTGTVVLVLRGLMLASLYAFLAYLLATLWRQVRSEGETVVFGALAEIRLMADLGPAGNIMQAYRPPSLTIGRAPACDFVVADETVSSRHALLSHRHSRWWLEDLGSRNGTRLNDVPVEAPTPLGTGDEIRCGDVVISVHLTDPAPDGMPRFSERQE